MLPFTNVIGSILMAVANIRTILCSIGYPGCESMSGKAHLCVLFVVLLILIECGSDTHNCLHGAIGPREPYFLSGQEISLTCITNTTATNLTFLKGSNNTPVNERYIHRFNQSAIKMVLPKVTAETIKEYKSAMHFRCVDFHEMGSTCYDDEYVQVEYFPMEARNVTCRVKGWQTMKCTWDLGVVYANENDINITCEAYSDEYQEVNTSFSDAPISGPHERCPQPNKTWCFWNYSDFTDALSYEIKINVMNTRTHNYTSITYSFNRDDVVEPDKVLNLMVTNTERPSCVNVSWTMPNSSRGKLLCKVSYSSNCDKNYKEQIKHLCNTEHHYERVELIICGLTPHVWYTFNVTNQQMNEMTMMGKGFHSEPEQYNMMTKSDVPRVSPEVTEGLYDETYVYWKPIDACEFNGESMKYIIHQGNETISVNQHVLARSQLSHTSKVTIVASNIRGSANVSSTVDIHSKDVAPSQSELVLECNVSGHCQNIFATINQKDSNSEVFSNVSHTLVWCQGKVACESNVQWKILEQKEGQFQHCDNANYRFGLITNGYHRKLRIVTNTGIVWATCQYEIGKVPIKPLTSRLIEPTNQDGIMRIEWDRYKCEDAGYITHYLVMYCFVKHTDNCSCTENPIKKTVPNSETSYNIKNIKSGSTLCASVSGVGRDISHQFPTKFLVRKYTGKEFPVAEIVLTVFCVLIAIVIVCVFWKCVIPKWHERLKGLNGIDMDLEHLSSDKVAVSPRFEPSEIASLLQQTDQVFLIDNTSGLGTSTYQKSENGTNKQHLVHSNSEKSSLIPSDLMHVSKTQNGIGSYGNPLFLGRVPGPKGQRNSSGDYASDINLHGYNQASDIEIDTDVTERDSVIGDSHEHDIVSYITPEPNMEREDVTDCNGKEQNSTVNCVKVQVKLDKRSDRHEDFINLNKKENICDVVELNTHWNKEIKMYRLHSNVDNIAVTATDAVETKLNEKLSETNPGDDIPLSKNYKKNAEIVKMLYDNEDVISELCDSYNESENLSGYKTCLNITEKSSVIGAVVLSIEEELDKGQDHFVSHKSLEFDTRILSDNSRISETQDQVKEEITDDQIRIKNEEASSSISDEMDDEPSLANYKSVAILNLSNIDLSDSASIEQLHDCPNDHKVEQFNVSNTEQRDVTKNEISDSTKISLNETMKTSGKQIVLQEQTFGHLSTGRRSADCNGSADRISNYSLVSVDSNQQQRLKAGSDTASENKFLNGVTRLNGINKTPINAVENS